MSSHFTLRPLALSLALTTVLGLPGLAHADFLYGRLVPGPGVEADGASGDVDVSVDGRTVVFATTAQNWVGDTYNGTRVIAVDLDTGVVEAISAAGSSVFRGEAPVVSGDGRYVAFLALNHALGPNWQALRKDRETGALELASSNAAGQPPALGTQDNTISMSADGRYVAFQAGAGLAADEGHAPQGSSGIIYVKDMQTGQVEIASMNSSGVMATDCALYPHALSATGRYLVMTCSAAAVPGATGGQAYVRDLQANTTELVSRSAGAPNGSTAFANRPAISPNGRFVSFQTRGYGGLGYANGVDSVGNSGVYLRDRQAGTTAAIPRPALVPADEYDSCSVSAISDIATVMLACLNNWTGTGRYTQVFLSIPGAGAPEFISPAANGQASNGYTGTTLAVNASGLSMAWDSDASDVDPNDHNGASDVFVLVEESVVTDAIFIDGFDPAAPANAAGGRARIEQLAATGVALGD
ncbi:MAG: hypothetical protein EOP90_06970 [Lysobacteraceae bacterium]|nr:MAG: hypothetical protein EOP90_06970 [Xanthomonadaceae bacterium]